MYLSEAYILMMSELACAGGLIIMNGKGAVRPTVGLAIAFVAYTVLLGTSLLCHPMLPFHESNKTSDDNSKTAAFHIKTPHYPYYIAELF